MQLSTHVLVADGKLESRKASLERTGSTALQNAAAALGEDQVDLVIMDDAESVIPETGVGGYTPTSHTVFVYINSGHPFAQNELEKAVRSTVTHEFHHAIRNRKIPWRTDTLLGAMVTEGLADHFDIEINGCDPPVWANVLSSEECETFLERARPELSSTAYNHADWFFGASPAIPRWAGYSLGFYIVEKYLSRTGMKASQSVYTNAEEIFT